ncbi:hypothetical protein CDAR_1751 [Caerostris darwini]|uniref:Secreted protein n=1 Tax=Caerostris darwini TaxID=1538125 RepID=A0AAV4R506_9ARAC|nr:hypothetical protein CDAR_1751 [Caerostris darwini]
MIFSFFLLQTLSCFCFRCFPTEIWVLLASECMSRLSPAHADCHHALTNGKRVPLSPKSRCGRKGRGKGAYLDVETTFRSPHANGNCTNPYP